MKTYILPFIVLLIIGVSSCEDIQDNDAVMQAEVDSLFFKSFGSTGVRGPEGNLTLQGLSDNEIITLHINGFQLDTYSFEGPSSNSYATFEDENGNIYSTLTEGGNGVINLTDRCISCGWVSGDFRFEAILPGIDTTYVYRGVFYQIPFGDGSDPANPASAGTVSAEVDGVPYNPVNITAVNSGNSILIAGANGSSNILLRLPVDVVAGTVELPQGGYQASYTEGTNTENAESGTITVNAHDPAAKTISGTFSFETPSYSITSGQFNVTYE